MCKGMSGFKMLLLLSCWIIAGIRATDPPKRHYRLKNSSFCLRVGKSPPRNDVMWTFNEKVVVLSKEEVQSSLTEKMVYNRSDSSLCVHNVTETESGTYEISLVDSKFNSLKEFHELIVEETVPRPVLRISVISSNVSAAFCNITATCSIQESKVQTVCDEDGCRTPPRSFSRFKLTISAENGSVVCSGSNNVSTSNVSESMAATCFNMSNLEKEETSQPFHIIVMVLSICIAACACLCTLIACATKRYFSTDSCHQTSPTLIQSQPGEAESQPVPRLSTSSSTEAGASYENVNTLQPSLTSSPTVSPRGELGFKQSQPVDTVYSYLQAPSATASAGTRDCSKDTKGHTKAREALTSQTVTLNEAQPPAQIDTVYSVLQKPKSVKSQHHQ